ncbi:MAG: FAD-binding oxidoreductase [Candidatus Pacebacteria bacterium]|jgi:FAD/FMN-containing dehydrogenase|nr:FAD-binding oxidoreductase [Candidatus Paceibacterota bacterium]
MTRDNLELQKAIAVIKSQFGENALDDDATLAKYSRDASLFEIRPQLVVFPRHSEDVQNLVQIVNAHPQAKLSITARSAGTDMSGGAVGESIIIDFTKHMQGMGEIGDDYAVTLPGTFYRDFEVATLKKGLIYPAYPASKSICAMGGIIGNNGAGEKTLHYGKAENYIKWLKVVFSDGKEYLVKPLTKTEFEAKITQNDFEGNIYKRIWNLLQNNTEAITAAKPNVSKNSAGYYLWNVWNGQTEIFDLTKLIVGSQGTLGIVTEICMKLVPIKKHSKMLILFMKDLKNLGTIVDTILPFDPESIESYDDKTLRLAIRFWRGFIRKRGFFGFIKMGLSFLPEFFMLLRKGIPKLVLMVEFAGDDELVLSKQITDLQSALLKFGIPMKEAKSIADAEKYWSIRRDSFALLREKVKGKHTAPFIEDIIVRPEYLPEFLPKLNAVLAQYPIEYTIAGHAGDGNFHIIPLMDFNDPKTAEIIYELSDKVYDLVLSYHGSITAEHNDGIIRTPYLLKMYGLTIMKLFEDTKHICDPHNIFNPGKKVGGTKEYIREHLLKPEHVHGS